MHRMQAGFSGGLVVDYPHSTRAKKFFLVLMVGPSMVSMPQVCTKLGLLAYSIESASHVGTFAATPLAMHTSSVQQQHSRITVIYS